MSLKTSLVARLSNQQEGDDATVFFAEFVESKTYRPGDKIKVDVFKSSNVEIEKVMVTAGSYESLGDQDKSVEADVLFGMETTATLRYPVTSGATPPITWYSGDRPQVTLDPDQVTLKADREVFAAGTASYTSTAVRYEIATPAQVGGRTEYQILILFIGRIADDT